MSTRALAARLDAATPPHRDRAVDALRALAIGGVILGHWLVTALVPGNGPGGRVLEDNSPLALQPALVPLSWVFQTLAVFFFVGGFAAARGYRGGYRSWLQARLVRLTRPVAVFAMVWLPLTAGLALAGMPAQPLRTAARLAVSPLWFLAVFTALTAATPLALRLVDRLGVGAAAVPAAIVVATDLVRFAVAGPAWVGWLNVPAGWLVPYLLGIAWARGALHRGHAVALLAGGSAATAMLVAWAGYPASMVGVNGARVSNLDPPTLAAVTFGLAQVGLAVLARPWLARWMRRPLAWAAVAVANMSAMTLFLWHQTALLGITAAGLVIGRLPGLHTMPAAPLWVVQRLAWLPVFAAALAVLWTIFHRAETRPTRSPVPQHDQHSGDHEIRNTEHDADCRGAVPRLRCDLASEVVVERLRNTGVGTGTGPLRYGGDRDLARMAGGHSGGPPAVYPNQPDGLPRRTSDAGDVRVRQP